MRLERHVFLAGFRTNALELTKGFDVFASEGMCMAIMAKKLVLLLNDDALRARMGEAALARARDHFTVERMVQGTSAVYERLVGALHHQ